MRILLLCLALLGPVSASVPAPAPGLPVEVEGLGLRFETPEGWRIDRESNANDLLLYPGKSKTLPLLRIRAFHGNFSARDRLPQMVRGLTDEERGTVYESSETWELNGRRFETLTVVHRKGVQEWHARFTLVDQPKKLQHAFWLFGRKKDLERQWRAVSTSIASARAIDAPETEGDGPTPPEEGPGGSTPPVEEHFTWQDVQSGLRITAWPEGFTPEEQSLSRLSKTGVNLAPDDHEAPKAVGITLSRRNVSPMVTPQSAAETMKEKVLELAGVSDTRQLQVRVAGLPATLLRWRLDDGESDPMVFQVYFFQRESALFRVDYSATEEWAGVRKRRDLLKKFVSGISFR